MKASSILLISVLLSNFSGITWSSEPKYKLSDIPENLKKNARSVVRKNIVNFEIISPSEAKQTIEYAVTVLNKNGLQDAEFIQIYYKFIKIRSIKAAIYNSEGELIKRFGASDIEDVSARSGYSLYEDHRFKIVNPGYKSFPFTFEYSCEIDYNGLVGYPTWYVYKANNISVQQSSLTVTCPKETRLRYIERNLPVKAELLYQDDIIKYQWEVINMVALIGEALSVEFPDLEPSVVYAPTDFEIDGTKGNCESWKNLGLWIGALIGVASRNGL